MKSLKQLIQGLDYLQADAFGDVMISGITSSSREVNEGFVFIALKGIATDGHLYINEAISKGAIAVVCSVIPPQKAKGVVFIKCDDTGIAYAALADAWYDHPSQKLQLIGITGTNGKTTTATLLYELFNKLGIISGLISTIRYCVPGHEYPATHTTPDAMVLNRMLNEMVAAGCRYCFMEVSSHAVVQHRIHALQYAGGVFTNLTHDHLDYHGTFAEYLRAKQLFFDRLPKTAFALYNDDDPNGKVMVQHCKARIASYALNRHADYKTKILHNAITGLGLTINSKEAWFRLVGRFNAYNLTAIYATATECGLDSTEVLTELTALREVDGRFNVLNSEKGITAVVDYAHTPDALKNVLSTLAEINDGKGRIITVAGAGGDRDRTKRPLMGKIMAEFSDQAIITSDNPRSEKPEDIIAEIAAGIPVNAARRVLSITDRRQAIAAACMLAQSGDIILVAGKGHETYQEVNGVRSHFNDMEVLNEYLKS